MTKYILAPISSEVIEANSTYPMEGTNEDGKLVITIDTRGEDVHARLGIPPDTHLYWGKTYQFDVQELSALGYPVRYRIGAREGYYLNGEGERVHFTTQARGIDSKRRVSHVVMRAAAALLVIGGMGYQRLAMLLAILFRIFSSPSSLQRWMVEVAGWLPNSAQMVLLLNERKTITELHLDELFPHGTENPLLVLRDEHGRLLLQEPVEKRDEAHVIPFLKRVKGWKLSIRSFHIDGCLAYFNAIHAVFGRDMPIQYDYFHIIQNIWRTLYSWLTTRRRALKSRARYVLTPWYEKHLQGLAQDLWTNRYLLFKNPAHLTVEEQEIFNALLKADPLLRRLRGFLEGVWHIFLDSRNEQEARAALQALKKLPIDRRNPQPFRKVIKFLERHFDWMITFLRYDSIQRNGLSETGMRTLRRLEFAHDGFRSNNGRDCFFRIYQAINYLDWPIYQTTFLIPPSLPG